MESKKVLKKKYPLHVGKLNRNLANKAVILKYATAKEREQYEKEIRSAKSVFDGIV